MQGQSTGQLKFLLHKELKPSDVSSLGRTVLPKVIECSFFLSLWWPSVLAKIDFSRGANASIFSGKGTCESC